MDGDMDGLVKNRYAARLSNALDPVKLREYWFPKPRVVGSTPAGRTS